MSLQGKKIVLGVSGSIAAYKTPELVRLLVKQGASVKVVITPSATQLVSPLALSTVSGHPVYSQVQDGDTWNNHVDLGQWGDMFLIAPCTANTLAKLATGLCDSILTAVYLSARCPVCIAPAMDEDMWLHPTTQNNLRLVQEYGHTVIPVGTGFLASGLIGQGRMAEPEEITDFLIQFFSEKQAFSGKTALITAGPTYEAIDPVRFIGNRSTGKMGIALAESLAQKGANVHLVLGPTHLRTNHPRIQTHLVETSEEMYNRCIEIFPKTDIAIMAAAVADYKPEQPTAHKIKKKETALSITLTRTQDILATLGTIKSPNQILVGFALETDNEIPNAQEKLNKKNADMIVLNSLQDIGAGFGTDTNKVTLLDRSGTAKSFPLQTKKEVAEIIINHIAGLTYAKENL